MNKTILITGSSSGIGKAAAKLFQRKGWNVVATMRRPDKETELNQLDRVLVTRLDVTDLDSIRSAVKQGLDRFGSIDALVNNAGYGVFGPLETTPPIKIREQFETNVFGLLETTRALLPVFRAKHDGTIINVSSVGGRITFPLAALYHGTKFAVEGVTEALSFELAEIGVKVKLVEPGAVKTSFRIDQMNDGGIAEYRELSRQMQQTWTVALASGSDPSEVAEVIYAAATDGTDQLRYVSGRDAEDLLSRRKAENDETFLGDIRNWKPIAA